MAVVRVNYSNGTSTIASNALTVSNSAWSPKATAGNLLILVIAISGTTTSAMTVTTPSGWTKATGGTNAVSSANVRTALYIFYKVAAGSDTLTSVTTANATLGRYMFYEYSGLAATTPLENTNATQDSQVNLATSQAVMQSSTITSAYTNSWVFIADGLTASGTPTGASAANGTPYTLSPATAAGDLSYGTNALAAFTRTGQLTSTVSNAVETHGDTVSPTSLLVRSAVSGYAVFKAKVTNSPPTATFSISRNFMVATMDGSGSSDPDGSGTIQYWNWTWGDGTTSKTTTPTTTHTYTTAGTYTIQLYVTDTSGANSSTVQLANQYFRRAPAAAYTLASNSPTWLSAAVDATASTSPDSTITGYAVDWGDGTTTAQQSSPTISHAYASRGSYTVKVTVYDATGASSWLTKTAKVNPPLDYSVTSIFAFMRRTLRPSIGPNNDYPLSSIAVDWKDGSPIENYTGSDIGTNKFHNYTVPGTYTPTITVYNTNGEGMVVSPPSAPQRIATAQGTYLDSAGVAHPGYMWYYYDDNAIPANIAAANGAYRNDVNLGLAFHMPQQAHYVAQFTGTNGAAIPSEWIIQAGDTGYSANIQGNKMALTTAAYQWAANPAAYLDGIKPIDDFEARFDLTLNDLSEQYPYFAFRMQNSLIWPGGNGVGLPQTGYAMVLGPSVNLIEIDQGYSAGTALDQFAYTFTSPNMKFRVQAKQNNLRIKVWAASVAEPSAWNYDKPILADQTSGKFMFRAANGPSNNPETVKIDNFKIINLRDQVALRDIQSAPVGNLPKFRQTMVQNFDVDAAPGTGANQFISMYSQSFQPYDDTGMYYPRQTMSTHNGVLDVTLDGTRGAAGSFGDSVTFANYVGGKFSIRAKAIGGEGNGSAVMLWPTSGVWAEGEIDYPESNYENNPVVNQHSMVAGSESNAQTIYTGVSWRDWHVYSIEWIPGTSVKYYLDDVLIGTFTTDVPTTPHRYMFQTGNYGGTGHLYIDWVAMWAYDTSIT